MLKQHATVIFVIIFFTMSGSANAQLNEAEQAWTDSVSNFQSSLEKMRNSLNQTIADPESTDDDIHIAKRLVTKVSKLDRMALQLRTAVLQYQADDTKLGYAMDLELSTNLVSDASNKKSLALSLLNIDDVETDLETKTQIGKLNRGLLRNRTGLINLKVHVFEDGKKTEGFRIVLNPRGFQGAQPHSKLSNLTNNAKGKLRPGYYWIEAIKDGVSRYKEAHPIGKYGERNIEVSISVRD